MLVRLKVVDLVCGLACLWTSAFAGAIVTRDGRVTIGEVTEKKSYVVVKVKQGRIKYKKSKLRWFTTNPRVTSIYKAARHAYKEKKAKVARLLVDESIKEEKETATKARELRQFIKEIGKDEPEGKAAKTEDEGDEGEKAQGKAKTPKVVMTPAMLRGNKMLKALSALYIEKDGKMVPYAEKTFAAAQFYVLVFATCEDPESRGIIRRMIHQHRLLTSDYGHKVGFAFIPTDGEKGTVNEWILKLKIPFPTLKYEIAAKSPLQKIRTAAVQIIVAQPDGTVVAKGLFDALETLREKLDDAAKE